MTSILASIGAAGIPEAGIVTMTLVFNAVNLPVSKIPLLLTVDWFLDRCRTTINVLGDVNVACILDGKTPPVVGKDAIAPASEAGIRLVEVGDQGGEAASPSGEGG